MQMLNLVHIVKSEAIHKRIDMNLFILFTSISAADDKSMVTVFWSYIPPLSAELWVTQFRFFGSGLITI